jgi:hypothetical protein
MAARGVGEKNASKAHACQGTAQRRALREVPQCAGQPEALGAWSGATACKGRQVRSPDWGPKTSDANKENGEEGCGR